ncbi:MAG: hypothetical protein HBSAPP01_25290 [Candidatus Brocadia sapporoensis]|nr:MAG: hypothetical protein HBSAPP01_25290 [Candidatus Brocadia sapporoensis]
MAKNFQSIKNLPRDIIINLIASLLGSALISAITWGLAGKIKFSILLFGVLIISIPYLLFVKYKRLFKLLKAGMDGYYYSFDLSENRKVFRETKDTFCYLGISSNSILEDFRKWTEEDPLVNTYSFLLTNPESPALKRQIAYEKGVSLDSNLSSLNTQLSQTIEHEVETEKRRINSAIEVLKNLSPFKSGKLRIRLHNEFIPWWMYIVDDKKIYLGILEKGKRGQDSPTMVISKNPDFPSPFDPFKNTWNRMWEDAVKDI